MHVWNEMTRGQLNKAAEKDSLVIITIGATEQHGPHLPVMTDNVIVEEIAKRSVAKAEGSIPIILGPNIPFGFSHHHYLYAGAISLSVQTLLTVLKETVDSVIKSGFKKIFILNSHGGNDEIIRLAAKEIAYHNEIWIGASSYWNLAEESLTAYKEREQLYDVGHAGQFETSLMLAIRPELVQIDLLKETAQREIFDLTFESVLQMTPESIWKEIDGYSDEPFKAQRKIGETLLHLITDEIHEALITFYNK
jgi:creatinine amidohydrolase